MNHHRSTIQAYLRRCSVTFLTIIAAASHVRASHHHPLDENSPYDRLSRDLITPHVKWAVPFMPGKVKILVIGSITGQRETVELAQRMDVDFVPLMTASCDHTYNHAPQYVPHSVPVETVDAFINAKIKDSYDTIVIGKMKWTALPEYLRDWVLEEVRKGAGLLYIAHEDETVESVLGANAVLAENPSFADGVPLDSMPAISQLDSSDLIKEGEFGKGRFIFLDYKQGRPYAAGAQILTPVYTHDESPVAYEYFQSLLAKAVYRCARKTAPQTIAKLVASPESVFVSLTNGKKPGKTYIEIVVRDNDNKVRYTKTLPASAKIRSEDFEIEFPFLKSGLHFVDVWLKSGGDTLDWASAAFTVSNEGRIDEINVAREVYSVGDAIKGSVILSNPPTNAKLRIRLTDSFDRVIADKIAKASTGATEFEFDLAQSVARGMSINAAILGEAGPVAEKKTRLRMKEPKVDDFWLMMMAGGYGETYMGEVVARELRRHGNDYSYANSIARAEACFRHDTGVIPSFIGQFFAGYGYTKTSRDSLVRNPCFLDPQYREKLRETLQTKTGELSDYARFYVLGVNSGISPLRVVAPLDLCHSEYCLADFREFLKSKYGSLESLNARWKRAYMSWDEVKKITFDEACKNQRMAPWVDHRMHMEHVFEETLRFARDTILETDPDAIVGLDEANPTSSFAGYDWARLAKVIDFNNPYFGQWHWRDDQRELGRAFDRTQGAPLGIWFGSYCRDEGFNRFIPWESLFHGLNGVGWWTATSGDYYGGLAPDLTTLPFFSQALEEIAEIKSGVGKLLMHSRRENDGVAILYSPSFVHAATIESSTAMPPKLLPIERFEDFIAPPDYPTQAGTSYPLLHRQQCWFNVLEDIGLQYEMISNYDLSTENLEKNGVKVLVLPYATALSIKESECIIDFVRNGGMALADLPPGGMDELCDALDKSPLAEIFNEFRDRMTVGEFGAGRTAFVGDYLYDYRDLRNFGEEHQKRRTIARILEKGGVKPRLRITERRGKDLGATEVTFFSKDDTLYACLLRDYQLEDLATKTIRVEFPRKAHIYGVGTGKYYGRTDSIKTRIKPGKGLVFAMSPNKIPPVTIRTDKQSYKQGETVAYTIKSQRESGALSQAARITLTDPRGEAPEYYSRNLLPEGDELNGELQLALNEKKGTWTIRLRDVVTGRIARTNFEVR